MQPSMPLSKPLETSAPVISTSTPTFCDKLYALIDKIKIFVNMMMITFSHLLPQGGQLFLFAKGIIQLPKTELELRLFPDSLALHSTSMEYGSQHLIASPFKSAVILHNSTVPLNDYYPKAFHNSDRGGFGHGKDNTNFAVVFDGCGPTLSAMNAAQAFTTSTLKNLSNYHQDINGSLDDIKTYTSDLFRLAAMSTEAGDATGGFVVFEQQAPDELRVNGGAVGDVAIFHIDRDKGTAHQLNKVNKKDPANKKDPGGCICAQLPNHKDIENPSVFSKEVHRNDVAILATDGLIDNIATGEAEHVIPLIIFSSKFDEDLDLLCQSPQPWLQNSPPTLPSANDLLEFIGGINQVNPDVDNETIAKRLNTYLKMVTAKATDLHRRQHEYEAMMTYDTSIDNGEKKKLIKENFENLKKENKTASKIDDCVLVVLSPKAISSL